MSPAQPAELFNLSAQGPLAAGLHGGALARGGAFAGATFRRGIDLSAGFDLEASVDASLRDSVAASMRAGAAVHAGAALQAAMPLDLFSEAGLVARLQVQAEAAAYVSASLSLEFDVFRGVVSDRLGPGPLAKALDLFLEEAIIQAGFWARAAFAAEILGQATLTGSLLPGAKNGSGFSFVLQYGAGFGYGTGEQFIVNIGLEDPRRLIVRLSERFTALLLEEADRVIKTLPDADQAAAEGAVPLLGFMLPLATRTAFEAGVALAGDSEASASVTATSSVVEAFGRQAQHFLLGALFDFATDALSDIFRGVQLVDAWVALDEQDRQRVKAELEALATALDSLEDTDRADATRWFDAVLDCVVSLGSLIDLGLVPWRSEQFFRDAMAYFYAAGTLAHRLAEWSALPRAGRGSLFGAAAATVPDNSSIAAHIATRIQKPPGSSLTLGDLVGFLVGANPIGWLRDSSPVVSSTIAWLEDLLELESDADLLNYILTELLPPEQASVQSILQRMGAGFGRALTDDVLPKLLTPLKQRSDDAVGAFLDGVIVPTLTALPAVVLPRLTELDDPEAVVRFREALSAVLLQHVGKLVLKALDVVLEHALTQGRQSLQAVGDEVRALGESFPAFGAVAAVASRAFLPVSITPDDLTALLQLAANATQRWNDDHRERFFQLLETVFVLGMAEETRRNQTFQTLSTTDDPAVQDDLGKVLDRVRDSTLDMLGFIGPRVLELLVMHYVNEVKAVAVAVYEGAKAVVAALEQGIAWLVDEIGKLGKEIERLVGEAARLGAKIAGDVAALAQHLRTLVDGAIGAVRNAGWALVDAVIPDWVPDWGVDIVKTAYNGLFDAVKYLLNLPLSILYDVANWVRDLLTALANGTALNAALVKQRIRQKLLGSQAYGLNFKLEVDLGFTTLPLGTVTLSAGSVLGVIADVVLGDSTFDSTVNGSVQDTKTLQQVEAQRLATQAILDREMDKAKAQNAVASLTTGQRVKVQIRTPGEREAYESETSLKVVVEGANRTFVDPPLGVPRRIVVRLNGREYQYPAAGWAENADGLILETAIPLPQPTETLRPAIAVTSAGLAPTPAWVIPTGTNVVKSDNPAVRFVLAAAPAAVSPAAAAFPVGSRGGPARAVPTDAAATWSRLREPAGRVVGRVVTASVSAEPLPEPPASYVGAGAVTSGARSLTAAEGSLSSADVRMSRARVLLEEAFDAANIRAVSEPPPVVTALVGQPGINVLQVAVSDGKQQTDSASVVFLLGTRSTSNDVTIASVLANPPGSDVPAGEHVVISSGADRPIDMTGWVLRDLARHTFTFPAFVLQPGTDVRIWTRAGTNDSANLYWGRRAAVWNNPGDSAVLHDAQGKEIARFFYGR